MMEAVFELAVQKEAEIGTSQAYYSFQGSRDCIAAHAVSGD